MIQTKRNDTYGRITRHAEVDVCDLPLEVLYTRNKESLLFSGTRIKIEKVLLYGHDLTKIVGNDIYKEIEWKITREGVKNQTPGNCSKNSTKI